MPVELTSRRNELVKTIARLSGSAAYRKKKRLFVAEGARLCADAARSGIRPAVLLYTARAAERYESYLSPVRAASRAEYRISPSVASFLAGTGTTQGVFCVCALPEPLRGLPRAEDGRHCLVLENIRDPANLGAVLRTAEALGFGGVLLTGTCCDAYAPKALRAGMGAAFRVPLFTAADSPGAVRRLNESGFSTFAAVPDADALPVTALRFEAPAAVAVGNEGSGLLPETVRACSRRITIPMAGRAESLNAAASAAILMWEMMRGRPGGRRL
ncbi:MAG TPA: RNA methyltransferase [Ruminococcaceae bacterium]|nr:RNA methyltransferase [Oscillospiraceae bacterium]HBG55681.1 RNA methyltransferase [Oscillospiraceae bacterium]HBQ47081.1 RNA methyltransferase [Oscillospiraceae bacterium]HBT90967.1 RNA methyltransferase [Oscillospiraceae bacterium]HCB91465.1 RNA methyltransferase [Oscillospiraceae bacterium]